jgi:myo-inositol-1(or 4)-monophosphatase
MTSRERGSRSRDKAIEAAKSAGDVILKSLGRISGEEIREKQASDFVTTVDKEAEQIIIEVIKEAFPEDHFLAEESLKEKESGAYRWIIDPLDGTTNFIHTYPVFSVSLALEYRKEIILGVTYDPTREELFVAEKEGGAKLNGKTLNVSSLNFLGDSLITTGFPFRKKEMIDNYLSLFRNLFVRVSDLRRAGSAALDLASLAAGRCDGFFEVGLSPWDIAAGSLLIKEAGGVVTDFGGGSDYLSTGNIVAGNPVLHSGILKEVQKVFGGLMEK